MSPWTSGGSMLSWFNKRGVSVVQGWLNFRAWGRIKKGTPSVPVSSPGLWVISKDIEKGVHAGFELPGSENVREMGNVAFPPAREKTGFIRQKQPTWQSDTPAWAQVALIRGSWYVRLLEGTSAAAGICCLSAPADFCGEISGSGYLSRKHQLNMSALPHLLQMQRSGKGIQPACLPS